MYKYIEKEDEHYSRKEDELSRTIVHPNKMLITK